MEDNIQENNTALVSFIEQQGLGSKHAEIVIKQAKSIYEVFLQNHLLSKDVELFKNLVENLVLLEKEKDSLLVQDIIKNKGLWVETLASKQLKDALFICKELKVNNVLSLVDIAYLCRINITQNFQKLHFGQCIEYFGEEYVRKTLTNSDQPNATYQGMSVVQQKMSARRYNILSNKYEYCYDDDSNMEQILSDSYVDHFDIGQRLDNQKKAEKIIKFCDVLSFASGQFSASSFFADITENEYHKQFRDVSYLGSYSSELKYFVEYLGIPFEKLFNYSKESLGQYCGVLRSLLWAYYDLQGKNMIMDFEYHTESRDISLVDLFTLPVMYQFWGGGYHQGNLNILMEVVNFIQSSSSDRGNILGNLGDNIKKLSGYSEEEKKSIRSAAIQIPKELYVGFIDQVSTRTSKVEFSDNIAKIFSLYRSNSYVLPISIIEIYGWEYVFEHTLYYENCGILLAFIPDENVGEIIERIIDSKVDEQKIIELKILFQSYQQVSLKQPLVNVVSLVENPLLLKNEIEAQKKKLYHDPIKNIHLIKKLGYGSDDVKLLHQGIYQGNLPQQQKIIHDNMVGELNKLNTYYAGLYSVGGKIHFPQSIDSDIIEQFRKKHGFDSTPFKTIHANSSILLPPSYFPEELKMMILALEKGGLLASDPQLQICIPGRLPNQLAGVLASMMLLLTTQHVEYLPESFGTTNLSETGRRLVVYDAGNYDWKFRYNGNAVGRTDILLLKDMNLIEKAQIIGSILGQSIYGGWFENLGEDLVRDYGELLSKYHLDGNLSQPRIYDHVTKNADDPYAEKHYQAVKAFTDHHYNDWLIRNHTNNTNGLLVFEVQKLLQLYREKIVSIQRKYLYS